MNPGNPGAPPPGPGFWQPPPPSGGMPPTTAQPAFAPPFRTPDMPPAGPPPPITEVDVPLQFRMPTRCVCCLGPSETRLRSTGAAKSGRTTERRTMDLPYCHRCVAHIKAGSRRGWVIGLVALALGAAIPFVLQFAWDYVPMVLVMASGPIAALLACAALAAAWKDAPIDTTRGCTASGRPSAWVAGFVFHGPSTRVRFTNPEFAKEMGLLHNTPPRTIGPRRDVDARWIATPILAACASVPAFFAMHGHVYFDNPTMVPMTIEVDDGAVTLSLPPLGHDTAYLPTGEAHIVARANGQAVDQFDGEVDAFGTHVATPTGTGCYAIYERGYGSTFGVAAPTAEQPGLRWHTLSGVDFVFEPFPSSVSVSQGTTSARRRRFARYDCETHVAQ